MSRRFLTRLAVFLAPFLIFLGITLPPLVYAGETAPVERAVVLQMADEPVLYGRGYRDNYYAYKLTAVLRRHPQVLVLGSSRSMQFRSQFLNRSPESFYNAGGAAQSIYEARFFLDQLDDESVPRVLILGLDEPWFNASHEQASLSRVRIQVEEESQLAFDRALAVTPLVARDLLQGKIDLGRLAAHDDPVFGGYAAGMNAIMNGNGFRNDGSYQYGSLIQHPESTEERLAEGLQRYRAGTGHQEPGIDPSEATLAALRDVLDWCRANGVYVFAFSPPYAPSHYALMMGDGQHTYIPRQVERIAALFEEYGYTYMDFSDPQSVDGTDDDMIDGDHPSEWIVLNIYTAMLRSQPEILGAYSDIDYLEEVIARVPRNPYVLFGSPDR